MLWGHLHPTLPVQVTPGAQPAPTKTTTPQPPKEVPQSLATGVAPQPAQEILATPLATTLVSGKNEVSVCTSLPLKGETGPLGNQILDGLSLFFNKMKKDKKTPFMVKLTALDDTSEFTQIKKNVTKLKNKSPLFTSFFGTESLLSIKKDIADKDVAVLFPLEGTNFFRKTTYPNTVFMRASHEQELEALISYAGQKLNKKKFAVFHEASEWGEACLATAKKIIQQHHYTFVASDSYPPKTVNIVNAANSLSSNTTINAIICIAQARPAYNFIQSIINKGLHKTVFLGLSNLFSIQETLQKARGVNIIIASVVPDPQKSKLPIVKDYRTDMKKYLPNKHYSPLSLEGYINAALLFDAIAHLTFPMTPQHIINYFQALKGSNFKGLSLTFDPGTNTLSQHIWLNTGAKKEWTLHTNPQRKN